MMSNVGNCIRGWHGSVALALHPASKPLRGPPAAVPATRVLLGPQHGVGLAARATQAHLVVQVVEDASHRKQLQQRGLTHLGARRLRVGGWQLVVVAQGAMLLDNTLIHCWPPLHHLPPPGALLSPHTPVSSTHTHRLLTCHAPAHCDPSITTAAGAQ